MSLTRRTFSALAAGAALPVIVPGQPAQSFRVTSNGNNLARKELVRGLARLFPAAPITDTGAIELSIQFERINSTFDYQIFRTPKGVTLEANTPQRLLHAVYDLLERQGVLFGIDGESYTFHPPTSLVLPALNQPWYGTPVFHTRGLLPWPDFLNCVTVFNEEDFRAYFENMVRMRFNTFGMHVYTQGAQWAESYLNFEFAGAGHLSFLDNSASHRWGYLPQRTSRYGMGAAQFYDSETFGSDATRLGRDNWEVADRTREMLAKSLHYAHALGLRTGLGFEPYQIPDELQRALPPEVRLPESKRGPKFNIESVTAKKLLEGRLGQMLEAYPELDHIWLWEDENMNWESRKNGLPLSTTPFLQAHDFLRRHAPNKRLVLSGWGGVARHFEYFHQKLPGDVVFSCLSDSLGWDPIHEVFGKMDGRQKWPIPWLEDDPGMWLPQFHAHRFQRDLTLAEKYGCDGMIGIHWRHRIVDPTATYMARRSWDKALTPEAHYQHYARTQAAAPRAAVLAATLNAADRDRTLLSTGTHEIKDGHVVTHEFSGDYSEGFTFWNEYEPDPKIVESQKVVAAALTGIHREAATAEERERIGHLSGHLQFVVPYTAAWVLAHRIDAALKAKDATTATALWLQLAPEVRKAMLAFQSIVATRNDLGTLASLQNKFVRLALYRLPLSIQELLGEMPPEIEPARQAALAPEPNQPARLIVPTRPTMLGAKDSVRLMAIVTGSIAPAAVTLHTRSTTGWAATPMKLLGRRTYHAQLTAGIQEYSVSAQCGATKLTSPRWAITAL